MPKPFELHFNPQAKDKDFIFETFCFKAQTKAEHKLGFLCFACKIHTPLSQADLLNKLAEKTKNAFYNNQVETAEQALNASANILKNQNNGNELEWALFCYDKKLNLYLVKQGKLFCLLYRGDETFDVSSNLNGYLTTVALKKNDVFLIATEDVFDAFEQLKLLEKFCGAKNKKEMNRVLKNYKSPLSGLFGFALLVFAKKPLPMIFIEKPKFLKNLSFKQQLVLRFVFYIAALSAILYLGRLLFN